MYASARISAGQSFLAAWSMDAIKDQNVDGTPAPNAADLTARRNEAKKLLTQEFSCSATSWVRIHRQSMKLSPLKSHLPAS